MAISESSGDVMGIWKKQAVARGGVLGFKDGVGGGVNRVLEF